jgi:nucleoside-diphosphate-sugar epimerase
MRVFLTGASGWVGTGVTRELIAAGHAVTGLVRSDAAEARVLANGATPLLGDLADLDKLRQGAEDADAVIHCGFIHDFSNYAASAATDRRAIETMGAVLAGSNRPLLVTAGLGVARKGPLCAETDEADVAHVPRFSEPAALAFLDKGVRVGIVRLPPTVHGSGDHGFVASLIRVAREKGMAAYVGAGENQWSAVHRDDAARLYLLALEKGRAGERYHAIGDEGVPFREIAAIIGRKLSLPVKSVEAAEAQAAFGWMAPFAQFDLPATSRITRERLGWAPTRPGLLDDLEHGTYFD